MHMCVWLCVGVCVQVWLCVLCVVILVYCVYCVQAHMRACMRGFVHRRERGLCAECMLNLVTVGVNVYLTNMT